MAELLSSVVASIVCIFKKHNPLPMGDYNYCSRCGKLELRKGEQIGTPLP